MSSFEDLDKSEQQLLVLVVKLDELVFHLLLDIVAEQALAATGTSSPPFECPIITSTASHFIEIVTNSCRLSLKSSDSGSCLAHAVAASRLLCGVELALRVLIAVIAVLVPDLVHEVFVLERLV